MATLRAGTTAVAGKTVAFQIEVPAGSIVTNASGIATLAVPIGTAYDCTGTDLETLASFAGDATLATGSLQIN